jgi:hypothetical protein
MANEKKDLLLLVADEVSSEKTAAAATLAWLAEDVGAEMETYISVDPWGGQNALSRTGHWHLEQFCFVANFYNVLYCAVSDAKALPFKRSAQAMGEILSVVNPAQIADLYVTVFGRYNRPLPDTAVMVSGLQPRDAAEEESMGALWMEPFCFPEILHRRALGLSSEAPDEAWLKLQARGLEKVLAVYCSAEAVERVRRLGLEVEVVDEVHPGDTYGSLIRRVADRWIDKTQMMGYGDQHIALASLGFFLRHKAVVFYQPTEWPQYIKEISPYAKKIGTTVVWGNQAARPMSDDVITEFGKYDLSMSLGIGVVGMTIREKIKLPPDWLAGARAPWESEYTDEFLEEQIAKGRIPVCYLLYAADLGHLTVFARLFDILCTSNTRCGMGFPSTWYDFEAEALEEMYIPYEQGGVFPRVEPLLSSTGLGVGTEARGFMTKETLLSQIRSALASIREHLGPRLVPIGYYPWEDACPYYQHQTAEPQWDVPVEAGFDYCITYQDEGELPKIVFQKGNLIAINQQNVHWWGGDGPVLKTKEWEKRLIGGRRPGWIMIGLDSPFWCQPPFYYDPRYPTFCKEETSVVELTAAMQYASSGGESGKLFLAKPHEVVRFARLLRARGLI